MGIRDISIELVSRVRLKKPPTLNTAPLLLRRHYNGRSLDALSNEMMPLMNGPAIVIAVGEEAWPTAYAFAAKHNQSVVRVRRPEMFKKKDEIITERFDLDDKGYIEVGLLKSAMIEAVNDVKEAMKGELPKEGIPCFPIDNGIISGHTMGGVIKLIRSAQLKKEIGDVRLRIGGIGLLASQEQGRNYITTEWSVPAGRIKSVLSFGPGRPRYPLEFSPAPIPPP